MPRALPILVAALAFAACTAPSFNGNEPPLAELPSSGPAWVDHPTPVLTVEALHQLVDLWADPRSAGACLGGAVQERPGYGRLAYVTHVYAAERPSRCPAAGHVGVVLFLRGDAARPVEESDLSCRVLERHPEWSIVGAMTGLTHEILRDPEGNRVTEGPAPVAWFCGWIRENPLDETVVAST